jgi:hypothetical protein
VKLLFTTLFSLFIFTISGQSIVYFEGIVIEDKSKDPVPDVVIVNVRNESSWVSDINGFFSLEAKAGDTLVFSKPGFSYRYASAKNDDSVVIALLPQNYLLDEVPITAYKLTSNLPKQIPLK